MTRRPNVARIPVIPHSALIRGSRGATTLRARQHRLQFQLSSLPNDAALTSTLRISNVRTFDAAAAAVPLPNAAAAGFAGLVCVALIGAVRRRRAQRLG